MEGLNKIKIEETSQKHSSAVSVFETLNFEHNFQNLLKEYIRTKTCPPFNSVLFYILIVIVSLVLKNQLGLLSLNNAIYLMAYF